MANRFWLLLILSLMSSCTHSSYVADEAPATTLTITSTKETNGGTPLYVVLKFTDFPHFLMEDYISITDYSISSNPDFTCFTTLCLIPGKSVKFVAEPPPGQSTGIYCLFTQCGERWKQLIDPSDGCKEVHVVLGEHEISSVEMR